MAAVTAISGSVKSASGVLLLSVPVRGNAFAGAFSQMELRPRPKAPEKGETTCYAAVELYWQELALCALVKGWSVTGGGCRGPLQVSQKAEPLAKGRTQQLIFLKKV